MGSVEGIQQGVFVGMTQIAAKRVDWRGWRVEAVTSVGRLVQRDDDLE